MHSLLVALYSLVSFCACTATAARISLNGTAHDGLTSRSAIATGPTSSSRRTTTKSSHPAASDDGTTSLNCSGSWSAWYSGSISYTDATTYTKTFTYYNISASTTTLCDGHPRVIGGSAALTTIASGVNSTVTTEFLNYTVPTPTCQLSPQDCSGDLWGVSSCTSIRSLSDCGQCTIYGQSVELKYFPVTTTASRDLCNSAGAGSPTLCPLASTRGVYTVSDVYRAPPCDYVTSNLTTAKPSGPYIVSAGHTLYHNRVYFSLDTVYASDICGVVGSTHTGAIVTLQSSEVYSVGGYHHAFADIGYKVDFQDFTTVPAYAYYNNDDIVGPSYGLDLTDRYRFGTDFINGISTADFGGAEAGAHGYTGSQVSWIWDEAYAPTLLMPIQIRSLDPAWASCSLNLVGLHDPPIPLTAQLTYDGPTAPDMPKTTEAAPASTLRSDDPPATADPRPTEARPTRTSYSFTSDPLPTAASDTIDPVPEPASDEESDPATMDNTSRVNDGAGPADTTADASDPAVTEPKPEQQPQASANRPDPTQPPLSSLDHADPTPPKTTTPIDDSTAADSTDENDEGASAALGIGGIIASILGVSPDPPQPKPATTTNALSVLESAMQTFDNGEQQATDAHEVPHGAPEPTRQIPDAAGHPSNGLSQLPQPEATTLLDTQGPAPSQQTPVAPITLTDGGQTHTLQPLAGSDGLYTIAPPPHAGSSQVPRPSGDHTVGTAESVHAEPITLTTAGYTQTISPVRGSPGIYTVFAPSDEPTATATHTRNDQPPGADSGSESILLFLTGPATYIANGQTHTIEPLGSASGVFVVDGSETVTQIAAPTSSRSSASRGSSLSAASTTDGSRTRPADSTLASGSGSLPPIVTASSSSAAEGSDTGGGGGGGGVMTAPPTVPNAGNGAGRIGDVLWTTMLALLVPVVVELLR